ncbi:transport protein Trs120 or TRAPPC9 TRAPP II complex subunit-domain-containing protein [Gorgonomyces haynaldii]|nr:transport protein Trs120 or TRAPPC9 TRAPP II complex subunit-domain-containing protein [Gorgonomyces haynaldii]
MLLDPCKIKILVVPVSPLDTDTFQRYYELLLKNAVVNVEDLTPPDPKIAKYTQNLYHNGYIYYDFVQEYDPTELQELETWRQVFGVIGIMDCRLNQDLKQGFKKFQQILTRYPTSLSYRCFAFEPDETQQDDTKGLIMIPNVGDLSFYLQTMINDFTGDIFLGLGSMIGQLERKTMINGPVMIAPQFGLDAASPSKRDQVLQTSVLNAEKIKKRTPGRQQKLIGDVYLMVGKLDTAIMYFTQAVELSKQTQDYQWQASATEGLLCSQLLKLLPESDQFTKDKPLIPGLATNRDIIARAKLVSGLQLFVVELPEKYREIVSLYDRHYQFGSLGFYPILQHHACFKMAQFLIDVHETNFKAAFYNGPGIASWPVESKMIPDIRGQGTPIIPSVPSQQSFALLDGIVLQNGLGASKLDILTWISRAWLSGSDFMSLKDHLRSLSMLSILCGRIGKTRKQAFFLRLAALCSQTLIAKSNLKPSPAPIRLFKSCFTLLNQQSDPVKNIRHGWPGLQVGVLREAIEMSEAVMDHVSTVYFTSILLRNLYQHLSRQEQQMLSDILSRVVTFAKASVQEQAESTTLQKPLIKTEDRLLGVPHLLSMTLVQPPNGLMVYKHEIQQQEKQVFLHNPFEKKTKKEQTIYGVCGEVLYVDIGLSNPFSFDIDVQQLSLVSDANFTPNIASTVVPSDCKEHIVRLSGVFEKPGQYKIEGVLVRMLGGAIEELCFSHQPTQVIKKHAHYYKTFESHLIGKDPLVFMNQEPAQIPVLQHLSVQIVDPQPMIELVHSSLGMHRGLSLLQGEHKSFSLDFKNLGKTDINLFSVTVKEQRNLQLPEETQLDLYELIYDSQLHGCWVKEDLPSHGPIEQAYTKIGPKQAHVVKQVFERDQIRTVAFDIFGKLGCTGVEITVEYGTVSDQSFYVRQLTIPILVTVVAPLLIRNYSFLQYTRDFHLNVFDEQLMLEPRVSVTEPREQNSFLLTFDLENQYVEPFQMTFDIYDDDLEEPTYSTTTMIHSAKNSLAGETLRRALFWYRHELIGSFDKRGKLVCQWSLSGRRGIVQPRDIKLDFPSMQIIKSPSIVIEPVLEGVRPNEIYTLAYKIQNKKTFFRVQCLLDGKPLDTLHWLSQNEQIVTIDQELVVELQFISTSTGSLEFLAHLEEFSVKMSETVVQKSKYEPPVIILGALEKMHWTREPFQIVVSE